MPLLTPTFCEVADLHDFMSQTAIDSAADHDKDGLPDTDVAENAINKARATIHMYLHHLHSLADLATSELIKHWCVILSVRYLFHKRGNYAPDVVEQEWQEEILPLLQRMQESDDSLLDLAMADDLRPTHSNLTVDRRYRYSKVRVTKPNSSRVSTKLREHGASDYPTFLD